MNKILKYGLITLAGAGGLLALLLVFASLAINPNDHKPGITQMVKEKKQRTLTLSGEIKLTFFPRLGLDLGPASISEYQGEKEFAATDSVHLALSWWPLLRKELVVDQVRIKGMRANLVRFRDGTTNFDDLLKKEDEDKQVKFDIDSVMMTQGALSFHDEISGCHLALSDITLKTGRLANGKPTEAGADFILQSDNPRTHVKIHTTTGLTFDTEARIYNVKGLNLEIQGEAPGVKELAVGLKLDGTANQKTGTFLAEHLGLAVTGKMGRNDFDIRVIAPRLQWAANRMATEKIDIVAKIQQGRDTEASMVANLSPITGDSQSFTAKLLKAEVIANQQDSNYQGKLSSPLDISGNIQERQLSLSGLKGSLTASNAILPAGKMKLEIAGAAQIDLQHQSAATSLAALLDESHIQIKAGVSSFATPHISLDLDIDQIDADRYLPRKTEKIQTRPEKPFDITLPKTLNASGSVHIGSLKLNDIKTRNVRLKFKNELPESAGRQ